MVIEIIIIIICFIIFLFTLYVLSREDFVLLRKNIALEEIFDVVFITLLVTLFFSRLFYVIFNFDASYLNPLVFFLVPYFPGLSLVGGVLGAVVTLLVITKQKKYPGGRFLDFFSVAFLSTLPVGYIGFLFTSERQALVFSLLPIIYYSFLLLFFLKILLPRFLQGQMKDGMLGLLLLMNYSLFSFILLIIRAVNEDKLRMTFELGILLILFIISLLLYIRQGAQLTLRRVK